MKMVESRGSAKSETRGGRSARGRPGALTRRQRRQDAVSAVGPVAHDHTPVLQVVDLVLPCDGPGVDPPRRDVRQVRPRGRWIRVIGLVRRIRGLDVRVAEARDELAGYPARPPPARRAHSQDDDEGHRGPGEPPSLAPGEPGWLVAGRSTPSGALPRDSTRPSRLAHLLVTRCPRAPPADGGSAWESNPPRACLEPDAGFEVREAHRDPMRFPAPRIEWLECITLPPGPAKGARVCPTACARRPGGLAHSWLTHDVARVEP